MPPSPGTRPPELAEDAVRAAPRTGSRRTGAAGDPAGAELGFGAVCSFLEDADPQAGGLFDMLGGMGLIGTVRCPLSQLLVEKPLKPLPVSLMGKLRHGAAARACKRYQGTEILLLIPGLGECPAQGG